MKKLLIQQLDRRLNKIRQVQAYADPPQDGWVRNLRKALGMTAQQLADRLNVDRSRVIHIEHSEPEGRITLKGLKKVATALNCNLVYALVPKDTIEDTLKKLSFRVSKELLEHIDHSMKLEKQGLTQEQIEYARKEMVHKLLAGSLKHLWEHEFQLNQIKNVRKPKKGEF